MSEAELRNQIVRLLADKAALQQQLDDTETKTEICKVAVKLPAFWPDKPIIWFAQVEAQFKLAGITADDTMFNYVVAQLDQKLAIEVEDIITSPPAIGQRYTKLKEELTRRLSMSDEQRVRQLISEEELGDRKPSQLLRHLRSLAGNAFSDDNVLRQLWTRRLPQQVQAILVSHPDLSLDKLAELADKIIEIASPKQIYSCSAPSTSSNANILETLVQQVEELGKQVASLSTKNRPGFTRNRPVSARRSHVSTPSSTDKLCWYHKIFNTKATKCVSPCSWKLQAENSSDNQ